MPNRRLRSLLFLSSYSPVFLLLALRAYDRVCAVVILSLVLLFAAALGVGLFLFTASRTEVQQVKVLSVESRDSDLAGYLVAYLLPFAGVIAADWRDVLAIALFMLFIGVVYVNSRMIFVNPLLAVFGYHLILVRATTDPDGTPAVDPNPQYVATKRKWVRQGDLLRARQITEETLFAFPKDDLI
jgi:hypothetical protein